MELRNDSNLSRLRAIGAEELRSDRHYEPEVTSRGYTPRRMATPSSAKMATAIAAITMRLETKYG